jgi:uncharacterized protein YbjT (DUF2867 family)
MARILVIGATGFIGRHLAQALGAAGHDVVHASRRAPQTAARFIQADFTRDHAPEAWLPRLAGIDVVINTVGILRQDAGRSFEAIHVKAPRALFDACATAGVGLVIQFSALGADAQAQSRYHKSKHEADEYLAHRSVPYVIVQPSLVYGTGGASARLFTALASAPIVPLPGDGSQRVQPIHIDDVVAAVRGLVEAERHRNRRVALVGAAPLGLREFLARLRQAMGLGRARFVRIPLVLVRAAARLAALGQRSLLDDETLGMLLRGNTADAATTRQLLGRAPRPVVEFIDADSREALVASAKLQWLLPVLRVSIALVWIASGVVSLGLYPVADSYALLARVGLTGAAATAALYGAAAMDIAFGIATLALSRRHWLWLAQMAAIVFYTGVITWKLPEFWLHPYGPVLKNLPMLAAIWTLYELERR